MTISTTTIKNSYSGNNTNLDFTYTFKITDDDDIQVIVRDAAGNETVKAKTTNYIVSPGLIVFFTLTGGLLHYRNIKDSKTIFKN